MNIAGRRGIRSFLLSAVVVAILAVGCVANVGQHAPPGELGDFGSFLHAGANASEGQNPYGPYAHGVNLNAPLSLLLFQRLARFNPETLYVRWYVLSLGIYGLALLCLFRRYPESRSPFRVVWALVWGSLWSSLWD